MNLRDFSYIYFLGIGGIGMSALARWFMANGYVVGGYDKTRTDLTIELEREGMDIHYDDKSGRIPTAFYHKAETLVIRTPAVPADHVELRYFEDSRYVMMKRAEVLGLITAGMQTLAVAGTHGKTTTSTLTAYLLKSAGKNTNAFLGGISANFDSNLLIGEADGLCVVEADEYDRSFLTLAPHMAVVTSADADHLDIYGSYESILESFQAFVSKIKVGGLLVLREGLPLEVPEGINVVTYGLETGEAHAENIRIEQGTFVFDYVGITDKIENLVLHVPGYHNVENAIAAITIVLANGVTSEEIRTDLPGFRGAKRRFEYILKEEEIIQIDDYGHHPVEVTAFLRSVKCMYPNKRLTCVFQPHLYTRTRDFADEFAESLGLADEVVLLDIYPARELPIPGVNSRMILDKVIAGSKVVTGKNGLAEVIASLKPELLVTIGAGDIDTLVQPLKIQLTEMYQLKPATTT